MHTVSHRRRWVAPLLVILAALAILVPSGRVAAQVTYPARPAEGESIVDEANLIDAADETAIRAIAAKLLPDKDIAIIVVTVESLARHNAAGQSIESYATGLFNHYGIGTKARNYGVLLLVSQADRKVRIELGDAYSRDRNDAAMQIISTAIIPEFRRGDSSQGIRAGVESLDQMARREAVPLTMGGQPTNAPSPATLPSGTANNQSPAEASQPVGGGGGLLNLFGCGTLPIIILVVLALTIGRRLFGGRRAPTYGYGGRSRSGSMLPGMLLGYGLSRLGGGGGSGLGGLGGLGGGGFGGRGGGGGFGGSSFGGGRSFGGGFSGGGGATGSW
ncbi:MAG: TPM domain-containing protein [Phycisphaerales bacterium]|nr:TPM domain-containing protein [Phycisphaerales bacterium]